MPTLVFIEHDGTEHQINGEIGKSLMQNAVDNNVPGIDADCGGECACATCHVFVDEAWLGKTGTAGEEETRLLGFAGENQIDCIFLGARGQHHGNRLYLGTVAAAISTRASCTVEIVRSPAKETH